MAPAPETSGTASASPPSRRTLVIVNPRSQNGATGRRWRGIEQTVRAALGPVEVEPTRGPRDAERIAREGVRAGCERVLVAGGDGTLSEVVTGLLSADLGGYAEVGVLPCGTGGDFPRMLGLPRQLDRALQLLSRGKVRPIDAGRADYVDSTGRSARAYFLNVASFGITGLASALVNRAPKALGGRVSFLVGTVASIARYESAPVSIRVDGTLVHDGRLILGTAANGSYFGGGMRIAPEAKPDDGLLDVIVISHLSKPRLLTSLPSLYRGSHLRHQAVSFHRGRRIEVEAAPGAVWLELDGEPLGQLPATFEVLPGAIQLIGAESA